MSTRYTIKKHQRFCNRKLYVCLKKMSVTVLTLTHETNSLIPIEGITVIFAAIPVVFGHELCLTYISLHLYLVSIHHREKYNLKGLFNNVFTFIREINEENIQI